MVSDSEWQKVKEKVEVLDGSRGDKAKSKRAVRVEEMNAALNRIDQLEKQVKALLAANP
ncbi:hypothetical protein [Leclercia sp.]|uniref:hypothetical protein n=1 Tax=Leclercia sp. TaxID=1898428 RepID=UPI0028BE6C21|nr:hypothetical protein [Leclercia sp.]